MRVMYVSNFRHWIRRGDYELTISDVVGNNRCLSVVYQPFLVLWIKPRSECPVCILLHGAARQILSCNKDHHHKQQPSCEHHQQSCVARGYAKLPAFEVFFILWKPLKSTALWWIGPECRMLTRMSMGMDLTKNYKWFKRSRNFQWNCLITSRIYQHYDTVT